MKEGIDILIDKTNWKKYRFDEVCKQINVTSKKPEADGLHYVIGLEHIEPGNLHITKWETLEKETTFTRKFVKGQVLFGRRRAYQRKVAYAEFDGICSGDILVFEAIEENLIPELLPFLIQSDGFFEKALATSAGSLSPRTKFKELADYEFLLPPKDEQKRLAELLWAADEMIEKEKKVVYKVKDKINLILSNVLGICQNGYYSSKKHEYIKVAKVLLKNKFNVGKLDTKDYQESGLYPIIDQSKNEITAYSNNKECVYNGTLPVLIFGDHTTSVKYIDFPFILGADGTKILSANEDIVLTKYLYYAIQNLNIIPQGYRRHYSILMDLEIPLLSIEKQKELISQLDTMESLIQQQKQVLCISQQLKQELINRIF